MSGLLDHLLNLDPVWLLAAAGLLVFLEDAVFIGFVIPGETAAVLCGVGSHTQGVPLAVAASVIVICAIAGDSVGYEVGKRYFVKLLDIKMLAQHRVRIARAQEFLRVRGGIAVFLGRFTAFFRAMMPALAGASEMHYPKFLAWNAAGGIVWGTTFVSLGFLFADTYKKVEHTLGRWVAIGLAVIVVAGVVIWKIRSERTEPDPA